MLDFNLIKKSCLLFKRKIILIFFFGFTLAVSVWATKKIMLNITIKKVTSNAELSFESAHLQLFSAMNLILTKNNSESTFIEHPSCIPIYKKWLEKNISGNTVDVRRGWDYLSLTDFSIVSVDKSNNKINTICGDYTNNSYNSKNIFSLYNENKSFEDHANSDSVIIRKHNLLSLYKKGNEGEKNYIYAKLLHSNLVLVSSSSRDFIGLISRNIIDSNYCSQCMRGIYTNSNTLATRENDGIYDVDDYVISTFDSDTLFLTPILFLLDLNKITEFVDDIVNRYIYLSILLAMLIMMVFFLLNPTDNWIRIKFFLTLCHLQKEGRRDNVIEQFYQPIVNFSSLNKINNAEVLVRWFYNEKLISPSFFLPAISNCNLLMNMLLIRQIAAVDYFKKNSRGIDRIIFSFNVSPSQIESGTLFDIVSIFEHSHPEFYSFEITEEATFKNIELAANEIIKLKDKGYKFKIDDFGAGFTSYKQVKKLDINWLKIDKSILDEKDENKRKAALSGFVTTYSTLNVNFIIEGVEREEQYRELIELGFLYFQGYFFSKPLSESDFLFYVVNLGDECEFFD
ncbi:EAL domain-containing protein [Aeromonas hydrophila]|uniref:EAL domain-containing protein n=1 Tax=Aeromonas hydrophila TaxID=644 RepID=UPI00191DFF56|nr:EAL domain-containing protein [Aeromonas hydrophila]MBL0560966.1 EAL domain-containing protein [Aeromonas hydrophila]